MSCQPGIAGLEAPDEEGLVPVPHGELAEVLVLRCRAEQCRRLPTPEERLAGLCSVSRHGGGQLRAARCFVAVALEVKWGALVEIGRSGCVVEHLGSLWWDPMRFEVPDGAPERVYLRFAVYEADPRGSGRPKLIATAGATVHQLQRDAEDARGRGVPLPLRALTSSRGPGGADKVAEVAGRACGTLWIERCALLGFPPDEAEAAARR